MKAAPRRWDELTAEQQAKVEDFIDLLLAEQPPLIQAHPAREVIERRAQGTITYQLEKRRCGKDKCKCAKGELHGPYWYGYWRQNGRLKSKYIGKQFKTISR